MIRILPRFLALTICLLGLSPHSCDAQETTTPAPAPAQAEVVIYGGTPAGVMAAVAAARQGHTVALVDINNHVGGVVSGGLVSTDIGDRKTVGGLADDFFKRIIQYYTTTCGPDSKQLKASHTGLVFEPHVAELVFEQMIREQEPRITLFRKNRYKSVTLDAGRVVTLVTEDTANHSIRSFSGDIFIDASYEGDLMAGALVPYRVGRESRSEYGEYLAGLSAGPKELRGLGDHRTMSYNYRVSITSNTENRVLFPKPAHYDPEPFRKTDGERIKKGITTGFGGFYTTVEKAGPNNKFDSNWCDFVGNSEGYAEGNWETRERIAAREMDFFLSRLYYAQNDPELPEAFRTEARTWGLPKDEFTDNGYLPFQLYVREARRMLGRYVLHEADLTQDRSKPDGICAGSYGVDCHYVQYLMQDGKQVTEHTQHVALNAYDIPYATLTPHEPGNLLVPVCLSASHVAYCSLRMEPVFMMLGQAAGDAAHLAIVNKTSVQDVDVPKLCSLLRSEGGIVDAGYQPQVKFLWTPERPKTGEAVKFSIQSGELKDPIKEVWWDFEGNGKVVSQEKNPEHLFTLDKLSTVSLLVEDKAGRRRLVTAAVPVGQAFARDVTMDECDADLFGRWDGAYPTLIRSGMPIFPDVFYGPGIHHDVVRNGKKPPARAHFQPNLPQAGRYQVCLGVRAALAQATNVPVLIRPDGHGAKLTVDERTETTPFNFVPIGEYHFKAGHSGFIEITNGNTDGVGAIDAIRWIWLGE